MTLRGEFIRVQCLLTQLSDEDPRRWPLEQREQELLREHEAKWLPKDIGNIPCVFRRGFVEEISLFSQDFPTAAERLFEQTPLQHVCLRGPIYAAEIGRAREGMGWERVVQSPYLARLRGLSLAFPLGFEVLRRLSESSYLANLTDLKLIPSSWLEGNSIDWASLIHRPTLRSLTLSHHALTLDDLPVLANASSLTSSARAELERQSPNTRSGEGARRGPAAVATGDAASGLQSPRRRRGLDDPRLALFAAINASEPGTQSHFRHGRASPRRGAGPERANFPRPVRQHQLRRGCRRAGLLVSLHALAGAQPAFQRRGG